MPERISASHILLGHTGAAEASSDRTPETARQEIEALAAQLAEGADFADLARANSDCPSARDGGSLGSFGRGMMVPEFETAAFELEVGQVSGLVETDFGYHLIRRND